MLQTVSRLVRALAARGGWATLSMAWHVLRIGPVRRGDGGLVRTTRFWVEGAGQS